MLGPPSMRTTTMGIFAITLAAAACMPTQLPYDDDSTNNDKCEHKREDVVISSRDDVLDLPDSCFTVSQNTVTIEASELTNLQDLKNLREVGRLVIKSNPFLETTEGLKDLRVLSELRVEDNAELFELPGFTGTQVLDRIYLIDNPHLAHLTGLANVKVIKGEFAIQGETNLGDLVNAWGGSESMSLLEGIGNFKLLNTKGLTTSGVQLLKTVATDILIQGNQDLVSLGELKLLSDVGGHFTIQDNPNLEHLNAFTLKFQTVGGTLTISHNDKLDSVFDMQWIYKVGGSLIVTYNPQLSKCRAEKMDETVVEVGGDVDIGDNSPSYDPCE